MRLALIIGAATTSLLLATTGGALAGTPAALPTGDILGTGVADAIDDSYIVVLKPGTTRSSRQLTRRYGGQVAGNYQATVRGFHARMTATQARRMAADPSVAYVEQDAVVAAGAATWGLDRIDQRALPLSKTFTAPSAAGVTVYVLDSGIKISHREFGGRASNGYDFIDRDAIADDCNGHGTHVAGTIGGTTNGVAKDVKLVGVRVLNCKGGGPYSAIIAGIDWVTARAARPAVANMSLGGSASKALDDAVNRSIAKGVAYVVAAGNDNRDACAQSPARTPAAITVGATDSTDTRASFSNWGSCVDLFAPGARIESAATGSDSATKLMSGTSMASPHVAGAAALVLAAHPAWTPAQVRDTLAAEATRGVRNGGNGSPDRLLYTGFLTTAAAAAAKR